MKITEDAPIEVTVYRSKIDGALVVEIDTAFDDGDEEVRVNLNDGKLYSGNPENADSAYGLLERLADTLDNTPGMKAEQIRALVRDAWLEASGEEA